MASDLPPTTPSPTSHDAHEYLPAEVLARLPRLGATEGTPDPLVQIKYFTPDSSWTWFAIEYDPIDGVFFGLVDGFEEELGYFTLAELTEARGPHGLRIERDLWFEPRPLSLVRAKR
jgi:Protein of unknown function (DUF2958)